MTLTFGVLISNHSAWSLIYQTRNRFCFVSVNHRLVGGWLFRGRHHAGQTWTDRQVADLSVSGSSSSSSRRVAFSRSLLPLWSSARTRSSLARTVYPPPAAGPQSLWHPCVSRQIWWIQVVGGRPRSRLHSCDGRSPSLALVQILRNDLIGWYQSLWLVRCVRVMATWPNRPAPKHGQI